MDLFYNIVVARSQPENLSNDHLIDKLLQFENTEGKLVYLNKQFDDFLAKYNELHSELSNFKKLQ